MCGWVMCGWGNDWSSCGGVGVRAQVCVRRLRCVGARMDLDLCVGECVGSWVGGWLGVWGALWMG